MKVYILQNKDREFASVNFAVAYDGFRKMGWEICPFNRIDDAYLPNLRSEDVVVGFIEDVNAALAQLGIKSPTEINYPDELNSFLGRKIWRSHVNYIAKHPELWNIFIKPANLSKKFTGRLVTSAKDLISCGDEFEDTEIWCSEPVKFLAEWRCFDPQVIEKAIAAYESAPAGYAADFGVTDTGETLLIEVNDGYSIGSYGLFSADYARLLASRWAQMTGTRDYSIY
jgi:ATP-grasp domain, R2K clade family 3